MLALQGQDYAGVRWSVGLRSNATDVEVEAAFDAGLIVRSWPLRGTLHLSAAEDLPWMLSLTAPRAMAGAAQRRAALGITLDEIERARELAIGALPGATTRTRGALLEAIAAGGVSTAGQRGYHLLWFLAQSGTLVLGPTSGREQTFARLEAWVPTPRRLERDEALGELAARYFRSHGPATVADLVRWSGLTVRDVRRGIAVAGDALVTLEIEGQALLLAAEALGASESIAADEAPVLLLPGFDEYVLGYKDRSAMLAPDRFDTIVPGGNGLFKPTVVVDGEVVGTWGRRAGAKGVAVEAWPFDGRLPAGAASGVREAVGRYGRYLGAPTRLVEPGAP
jgi:DNA glycosylase AlkZ-like